MCKVLENRSQQDEERMEQLTNQLKEARLLAEDADGKSDEVARKLAFVEDELEVAEDRVKSGESKIMELEEELKVIEKDGVNRRRASLTTLVTCAGRRKLPEVVGGLRGEGQPASGGVQARDEDPDCQAEGGREPRRAGREVREEAAEGGGQARRYVVLSSFPFNIDHCYVS